MCYDVAELFIPFFFTIVSISLFCVLRIYMCTNNQVRFFPIFISWMTVFVVCSWIVHIGILAKDKYYTSSLMTLGAVLVNLILNINWYCKYGKVLNKDANFILLKEQNSCTMKFIMFISSIVTFQFSRLFLSSYSYTKKVVLPLTVKQSQYDGINKLSSVTIGLCNIIALASACYNLNWTPIYR